MSNAVIRESRYVFSLWWKLSAKRIVRMMAGETKTGYAFPETAIDAQMLDPQMHKRE